MSDPIPSAAEEMPHSFHVRVQRLINHENAGSGKGHFSLEAQGISGAAAIDLSELDEIDNALLELFEHSLEETITLLDSDPYALTDEYRRGILTKLDALMVRGATPTQKLFRSYINNKFAALTGQIQLYARATLQRNTEMSAFASREIRSDAKTYLALLKGGE